MLTTITWEVLGQPQNIPTVYPALILSLGFLITVSLITPKPGFDKLKPFFKEK